MLHNKFFIQHEKLIQNGVDSVKAVQLNKLNGPGFLDIKLHIYTPK